MSEAMKWSCQKYQCCIEQKIVCKWSVIETWNLLEAEVGGNVYITCMVQIRRKTGKEWAVTNSGTVNHAPAAHRRITTVIEKRFSISLYIVSDSYFAQYERVCVIIDTLSKVYIGYSLHEHQFRLLTFTLMNNFRIFQQETYYKLIPRSFRDNIQICEPFNLLCFNKFWIAMLNQFKSVHDHIDLESIQTFVHHN